MNLMMSKKKVRGGHIAELQKEIDTFKSQIDDLCENELPHLGAASPERLNVYKRATGLKLELSSLNQKLNGLSLKDAKISTKKFESTKTQEKRRLEQLQKRLDDISEQLEPDEVEEEYFRTLEHDEDGKGTPNENVKQEDENEYEDEDEDEDEEEDEEEDYEVSELNDNISEGGESEGEDEDIECHAECLKTFQAEEEGDLSFSKGEHLMILKRSDDGWWSARNEAGVEGVIPSTLIKIVQEKDIGKSQKAKQDTAASDSHNRSGKQLWNILKEKKPVTKETSINDVLKAMKAAPSGFRSPTLGTWYHKEEYRIATWVVPKTTPSKLQFRDLHWDVINKKLREHPVNVCRVFSLVSVRCVPPIGAGVQVLSRHVYVALWDEEKILSNIHLIRAVPLEQDMAWSFTPKIGKNIPSLYDGEFVARIDSDDKKLSLLFEFNYTYKRTSTEEQHDICCGWASLPLFEMDGTAIPNKNFELNINGGTPFEKDIPLDPTTNVAASQSLMQSLIRSNQQARVLVKSTSINRTSKETYDMLPATILTCQKHAPFIGFYRQHAAMIYCREDKIPSEYMCDPLLAYFPRALSFPDLMDALKMVWEENVKNNLSRTQRKNLGQLQTIFKHSFTESVFGLMHCANIPPFVWGDDAVEKARSSFIQTFLLRKDPLGNLLSPDYRFKPADINKLTYTVLSKHSLDAPILDRASLSGES